MSDTTTTNRTVDIDSPDALVNLVRDCLGQQTPIVNYGVGHRDLGYPPPADHVKLVQRGGVIEHYQRDFTVRAAAGITVGDLQKALGPTGQFAPVDADDDITLGEVIDHNVYGPLRVQYGAMRDLLLGLHYVDGQGRDIHVGGRTVKNVAGYDVTRFMCGGLGEYGVVHEATMRTYAVPAAVELVTLKLDDVAWIDEQLAPWLLTPAAPAALSLDLDGGSAGIELAYIGTARGCQTQLDALKVWLGDEKPPATIESNQSADLDAYVQRQTSQRAWRRDAPAVVKIVVQSARTAATCARLADLFGQSAPLTINALPVHGCIFAGGRLDASQAVALDAAIRETLPAGEGFRVWYRRPTEDIEPFAPAQPEWPTLLKLKHTMDPHRLFNPGRFIETATEKQST